MLIDQEHGDILALLGEGLESPLNLRVLGLAIDDEEVSLGVGWVGDMLWTDHRD